MIVITNQPLNPPHNAYNNSILEFGVDAGTPVLATLSVDGYSFGLSPGLDGFFYYNLKNIISVLINQNHFSDEITVPDPTNFMFLDQTLFMDFEVTLEVELLDGQKLTKTINLPFIKSVDQIIRKRFNNTELKLLAPYANDICSLSYFEGYPFDISIYSNVAREITISNLRTGMNLVLNLNKGVNRLFISNGENDNLGFESQLPLYIGVNELEFRIGPTKYFTLLLDKKAAECGQLLKFFNQDGGWSYWRFHHLLQESVKTKTIQQLKTNFNNIDNLNGNFSITGKEAETTQQIKSGLMNIHERKVVGQLPSSPKVYLYTNALLQPFEKNDFVEINVANGTLTTSNKSNLHNIGIKIELPKTYTQTL